MYTEIADFYNREMPERYYDRVSSFFCRMMKKYARPFYKDNNIILDCGCGSGILTGKLADRGYDMIGLDISEEMLDIAREEQGDRDGKILWVCQDMTKMNLFGTVAGLICATDTVCHLTGEKSLAEFFRLASNYVEPGGIFVFDALTEKYFTDRIDGNVFYVDGDNYTSIWHGKFNPKSKICRYEITVFETDDGDNYVRNDETVREKAYGTEFLKNLLVESGFEIKGIFGSTSCKQVTEDTERVYFVAKKPELRGLRA